MRKAVEEVLSGRLEQGDVFEAFIKRFRLNRFDEVLEYRPYDEGLERSYSRTCEQFGLEVSDSDVATITGAVFSWGPARRCARYRSRRCPSTSHSWHSPTPTSAPSM